MPEAKKIPDEYLDLFQKRAFGHLATLMPDGSPHVTPVWVDYDGTHVLVNSALGRQKDRNMRARPRVAIEIQDPDNPYRYLMVRGTVIEITEEGAREHINKLSAKYTGNPVYGGPPDERRVTYRVRPERVTGWG